MATQLALPPLEVPARLVIDIYNPFNDRAYAALCAANPDLRLERNAQGEIIIVPPPGGESSYREAGLTTQLSNWAIRDGRGYAFGSSVQFILPSGAARSPVAAWVSKARLSRLTKRQRRQLLRLVPEFVVEVMSPSDRLSAAQQKMEVDWMGNGVELGWLIDGDSETVYVYRAGHAVQKKKGLRKLSGQGPVKGFVLDLSAIWEGL